MLSEFSRTEMLLGKAAMEKLTAARVAIFGIGGVGSYTVEGLARCGVGAFILVDSDCVCLTNINRQLHATRETIGRFKVDVMRERILSINPNAVVECFKMFYLPGCAAEVLTGKIDYLIDAVDTVSAKIDLVVSAKEQNIPVISSMGAGNKLDPTRFEVVDIYKTSVCPLARVMRRELRQRGVESLKVVYSREEPLMAKNLEYNCNNENACLYNSSAMLDSKLRVPGSISFVPSVAGLIMAGEVVKDIIMDDGQQYC